MAESIRQEFEDFRRIRREIVVEKTGTQQVQNGVALAIGILLGGGFPGSAAAVSVLAERAFPDVEWAWRGADEDA
jgi:hypothetical protein